jgi:nitrile hydratase
MSEKQQRDLELQWGALIAQSWADESYRQRLLEDPASALKASGVSVPADVQLKIVEDVAGVEVTGKVINLPLPKKPCKSEFSSEEIHYDNILKYANYSNCNDKCNCVC